MPITSKAAPPFVRSVGSGPRGGTVKGEAMKRLQPYHADGTDFTSCLRVGPGSSTVHESLPW